MDLIFKVIAAESARCSERHRVAPCPGTNQINERGFRRAACSSSVNDPVTNKAFVLLSEESALPEGPIHSLRYDKIRSFIIVLELQPVQPKQSSGASQVSRAQSHT